MGFLIGDKIVYPLHGAGIIEAIECHEISGEKQKYYVLSLQTTNMKVLVPENLPHEKLHTIVGKKQLWDF